MNAEFAVVTLLIFLHNEKPRPPIRKRCVLVVMEIGNFCVRLRPLDGRNRTIGIAESLARVVAEIRITRVRWRSFPPPKTQK